MNRRLQSTSNNIISVQGRYTSGLALPDYYDGQKYLGEQQLDIPYATSQHHIEIPRFIPGRINTDDFIFFQWDSAYLDWNQYEVVVEALDVAGDRFRKIGPLRTTVDLPFVQFDAYSRVGVVPLNNPNLPSFWSRLCRASTYILPRVSSKKPGNFKMERTGILTSGVGMEI